MFNSFSNQSFSENNGYSDCAINSFCSVDPIIYSLMEVLLYELKQITYYYLKLQELGYENKTLKSQIINYLSLILIGYEFNRDEFESILKQIHKEKEATKNYFTNVCDKRNIDCQILKSKINFEKFSLASIVNQGEKQAIVRNKLLNSNLKNLYEIILNLLKSASTRLVEMKEYTTDYMPEEDAILKLFNSLNFSTISEEKLVRKINDFSAINYRIHRKLHELKEEYFGKISLEDVYIGAKEGQSILVSGQNLKDFEIMLEATKNMGVNVYTHDGLIVAHAYPKFKKYPHLKGHFQMSLDSFQFDFASFKGSILVIRNFQYFLDRLYRGRLFTTNIVSGKGMTKIDNGDFQPLIQAAKEAKGYKHNHKIAELKVGYDEHSVMKKVDAIIEKIKEGKIKYLVVIGLMNHSAVRNEYFEKMIENLPDDYYVISTAMSYILNKNALFFDSFFNSSLIYKILSYIKSKIDIKEISISVFITTCNLHTLSHLFNLRYLGIKNIFLPKCSANIISPAMKEFLKEKFNIKQVSDDVEADLKSL